MPSKLQERARAMANHDWPTLRDILIDLTDEVHELRHQVEAAVKPSEQVATTPGTSAPSNNGGQ